MTPTGPHGSLRPPPPAQPSHPLQRVVCNIRRQSSPGDTAGEGHRPRRTRSMYSMVRSLAQRAAGAPWRTMEGHACGSTSARCVSARAAMSIVSGECSACSACTSSGTVASTGKPARLSSLPMDSSSLSSASAPSWLPSSSEALRPARIDCGIQALQKGERGELVHLRLANERQVNFGVAWALCVHAACALGDEITGRADPAYLDAAACEPAKRHGILEACTKLAQESLKSAAERCRGDRHQRQSG